MKEQNFSFLGGDVLSQGEANRHRTVKAFNWDEAAKIIKEVFANHPDLVAEAGLRGDWAYTGGVIFEDGKPTNEHYTYLASTWATPSLVLIYDGHEQEDIPLLCTKDDRFDSDTKWDETSLAILGIEL